MPVLLWVLLILLVLLAVLSRLRVGLRLALRPGALRVEGRIGPLRLSLLPERAGKGPEGTSGGGGTAPGKRKRAGNWGWTQDR